MTLRAALSEFRADIRHTQHIRVAASAPLGPPSFAELRFAAANPPLWALAQYRFARYVRGKRGVVGGALKALSAIWHKIIEMTTGIAISRSADIGPGLAIVHGQGVVLGDGITMGDNCVVFQGVTVGLWKGVPTIERRAYLAPGAKVFGRITVGEAAHIGANAVVNKDVPAYGVAVGLPARVIKRTAGFVADDGPAPCARPREHPC